MPSTSITVTIGDSYGNLLAEIQPELSAIPWRLNKISKITMRMPKLDPKLKREYFLPGNRVYVEFSNGLPAWGGIIDPPHQWSLDHYETTVYSPEQILSYRETDRGRYFDNKTAAEIFASVLAEAKAFHPLPLEIDQLDSPPSTHSPEYHFKDLLYIVQKSLKRIADVDFAVKAQMTNNRIVFRASLYRRRGTKKPNVVLMEGINISEATLIEQGPIINSWNLAGGGTGWGEDRIYAHAEDVTEIGTVGLRQNSKIYSDIKEQGTLDDTAEFLLDGTRQLVNRWALKTQNIDPAAFSTYDIGDTIRLVAPGYSWEGTDKFVRVLSRIYDPDRGETDLIIEETEDRRGPSVYNTTAI